MYTVRICTLDILVHVFVDIYSTCILRVYLLRHILYSYMLWYFVYWILLVSHAGPLAAYVSVKDKRWLIPVQLALGNLCFAYWVDNHNDLMRLQPLIDRLFVNKAFRPSVIIQPRSVRYNDAFVFYTLWLNLIKMHWLSFHNRIS